MRFMLSNGTKLAGAFEILGPLGSGAMGEVYRARDLKLGREVAIKVLPTDLARDVDRMARFEHEARTASALNHPNIVTVHDVGRDGDTGYLVLELVQGRTLRDRLLKDGLPWRTTLQIAEQIAAGLAAAHASGIVHRDLKPENIMVRDDGVVKILDFGLAKLHGAGAELKTATALTSPGAILGTVGYMSPEQARGEAVDWRSDQFALGALIYEMATGIRPFSGASTAQTLTAIIEKDPEPINRSRPDAPHPVLWILDRCLAKDPRDRYGSTFDLARDLRNVREHLSQASSKPNVSAGPIVRRRRRAVIPALSALLGLAAGAILGWQLAGRAAPRSTEPPKLRTMTFSGADYCPSASADGRMLAFVSRRDGVPRIWLRSMAGGGEVAVTSGPDNSPRFSPDGSSLLFMRGENGVQSLYRVATLGGEARKLIDNANDGDWSPDGTRIVFLRAGRDGNTVVTQVAVARTEGGGEQVLASVRDAALLAPRWSPDGRWIAVSAGQFGASESKGKFIQLVRADGSGAQRLVPSAEGGDVSGCAWLDDGHTILYSQGESVTTVALGATVINSGASRILAQDILTGKSRIVLWQPSLGTTVTVVEPGQIVFDATVARQNLQEIDISHPPAVSGVTLSQGTSLDRQPVYTPDGEWVAFSSNRSGNLDIWARSRHTSELRQLTDQPTDDWDPAFTRDGKQLIWTSRRGGNFEIWMANADGSAAHQITHDGADAENATATPDGKWLVYNSANPDKSGIWKIRADGTGAERLVAGTTAWPEVSPDGVYACYAITTTGGSAAIGVIRIADGQTVPFHIDIEATEIPNGRSRWLPDGRSIAFNWRHPLHPGIYAQDFRPGSDTSSSRRPLVQLDDNGVPESFGISPDGMHLAMSASHRGSSLMSATNVVGVAPPRRKP